MFTGIIEGLGEIKHISSLTDGITATISVPEPITSLDVGESIAVNGVCSTAKTFANQAFDVDYMAETLNKTTFKSLAVGNKVNLERCLTLSTRLSGHMVQGHVDGIGKVRSFDIKEPWGVIEIEFDPNFRKFLLPKGAITIDGISLTVVDVTPNTFTCHLIPHTIEHTILHTLSKNSFVNLEFDLIGKYLYNFKHHDTP